MSLRQDHELSNLLVQSTRSVSVSEQRLTNPSPNPALTRTCYHWAVFVLGDGDGDDNEAQISPI